MFEFGTVGSIIEIDSLTTHDFDVRIMTFIYLMLE